jgi:hypothetical protein
VLELVLLEGGSTLYTTETTHSTAHRHMLTAITQHIVSKMVVRECRVRRDEDVDMERRERLPQERAREQWWREARHGSSLNDPR